MSVIRLKESKVRCRHNQLSRFAKIILYTVATYAFDSCKYCCICIKFTFFFCKQVSCGWKHTAAVSGKRFLTSTVFFHRMSFHIRMDFNLRLRKDVITTIERLRTFYAKVEIYSIHCWILLPLPCYPWPAMGSQILEYVVCWTKLDLVVWLHVYGIHLSNLLLKNRWPCLHVGMGWFERNFSRRWPFTGRAVG